MAASSFIPFAALCVAIFAFTYLFALVPLLVPLSSSTLRKLHLLGSGVLLGAAFTVVIPEGAGALYRGAVEPQSLLYAQQVRKAQQSQQASTGWAWSGMETRSQAGQDHHMLEPRYDADSIFGYTLLAGFFLMFIIDQLSKPIRSPPPTRRAHPPRRPEAHRMESSRSVRGGEDLEAQGGGTDEQGEASKDPARSPELLPADYDHARSRDRGVGEGGDTSADSNSPLLDRQHGESPRPQPSASSSTGAGSTMLVGLLIHAAADGIAMGAGAASEDKSLRAVLVMAIMVHKAPAAIALCTLLLAQGMHRPNIRKSLAAFSASTPLGAVLTYLLLSFALPNNVVGLTIPNETSPISPRHIGIALCFSGGTFLYVALHALQNAFGDEPRDHDEHRSDANHDDQQEASQWQRHNGSDHHRRKHAESTGSPWLGQLANVAIALAGAALPSLLQKLGGAHEH